MSFTKQRLAFELTNHPVQELLFDSPEEAAAALRMLRLVQKASLKHVRTDPVTCVGRHTFTESELNVVRFLAFHTHHTAALSGKVLAIRWVRELCDCDLSTAKKFVDLMAPQDEGPKPCGEIPLVPAQPCALTTSDDGRRKRAREYLVQELTERFVQNCDMHPFSRRLACIGHKGYNDMTDAEIVEEARKFGLAGTEGGQAAILTMLDKDH